jgi:hypothetical protein
VESIRRRGRFQQALVNAPTPHQPERHQSLLKDTKIINLVLALGVCL